tara:strand:+ start:7909 stop:9135 length:1227 start_codon:yes stop_codon:yes gene_type:complete
MTNRKRHLSRPGPRIILGLIAAVVIVAAYLALRTPPIDVDVAKAVKAPLLVTIDDEGETRVSDIYMVAAPISGELQRIDLEPGDPVVAGQTVIARILPAQPDFLDPRSESETRAQIRALEASVESAAARIAQAQADSQLSTADFERTAALYKRGFATRAAYDGARAARDSRVARLEEARGARENARFELRAARARLMPPSSVKSGGKALAIRSPESGSVLRLVQESATMIAAGSTIMELGNPKDIEIVTDLLSSDAVKIRAGSEVLIDHWGGDKPLKGRVRRIEPYGFTKVSALGVEEQRVNVIIDLVDPLAARKNLGHGYRVIVRVVEWSRENVLQVPISALFRDRGQWSVFVMQDGRAHLVPVRVGRMNDERAQIVEGLKAGASVILHPSEKIDDGVAVRLRAGVS